MTTLAGRGLWCALTATIGMFGIAVFAWADEAYVDEAAQRGVWYTPLFGGEGLSGGTSGKGVAFTDLDRDGDPDLVVCGAEDGVVGVYENDGDGHFINRSLRSGIPLHPAFVGSTIIAGDYDSDGDPDLYFGNWGVPNVLMRNDGDFTFTDVTDTAGVGDAGWAAGSAWGDYDRDGHLDLYVGNVPGSPAPSPNRLYRNMGDGTFVELGALLGVDDPWSTWQAVFVDYNLDGWPDIYVSNDKGVVTCTHHNHLFENVGGVFIDVTEISGTEACADSMGVAVGDLDHNGWPDLYCTNIPAGNPLLMNQGDGTFVESFAEAGVGSFAVGWGAHFFDADHNGFLDLFVCNADAPNRLYMNDGTWPLVDAAATVGVADAGVSYAMAAADVDLDGDIDLVVQNDDEPIRLYIRQGAPTGRWISFDVRGVGGNTQAIGALVNVISDGVARQREVAAGGTFKSQNELPVHVGLGRSTMADVVEIRWTPDEARVLENYPADQRWVVHPDAALGDADGNGVVDFTDFSAFAACFTPDASVTPGCELMDLDGDGSAIGLNDFARFLARYVDPIDDCDGDGVPDLQQILLAPELDADGDGVLDGCPPLGDLNSDGDVTAADLAILLASWGACAGCPADLDGSAMVDGDDIQVLLEAWTGG